MLLCGTKVIRVSAVDVIPIRRRRRHSIESLVGPIPHWEVPVLYDDGGGYRPNSVVELF